MDTRGLSVPSRLQRLVLRQRAHAREQALGHEGIAARRVVPGRARELDLARLQEERLARFMQKSAGISAAKLAAKVGHRMEVLVDGVDGNTAIARTMGDAPEIDGVVKIVKGAKLPAGEFVDVEITGSSDHDLEGKVLARS